MRGGIRFCFFFCSVDGCVCEVPFSVIGEEMWTERKTTESIHIAHLRARIIASVQTHRMSSVLIDA